jgi:hypothetical protein
MTQRLCGISDEEASGLVKQIFDPPTTFSGGRRTSSGFSPTAHSLQGGS